MLLSSPFSNEEAEALRADGSDSTCHYNSAFPIVGLHPDLIAPSSYSHVPLGGIPFHSFSPGVSPQTQKDNTSRRQVGLGAGVLLVQPKDSLLRSWLFVQMSEGGGISGRKGHVLWPISPATMWSKREHRRCRGTATSLAHAWSFLRAPVLRGGLPGSPHLF